MPETARPPAGSRHQGHGRRLTAAFAALEAFPMMAESRDRLLSLLAGGVRTDAELVRAVEADVALSVAVLRHANLGGGEADSARAAVAALSEDDLVEIVSHARTYDFLEQAPVWKGVPERFRLHGVATQRAAERIALLSGYAEHDRLMLTALLHDIGKLVLLHAYPGYQRRTHAETARQRVAAERRELGFDHAAVGGVLARRWGLPHTVAATIESHHTPEADGAAAIIRLADLLAHYVQGRVVDPAELRAASAQAGLAPEQLRTVMYDLPLPAAPPPPRVPEPCPLSTREMDVLDQLAQGLVYKQIAVELELSSSTVRTHLHNVYKKLGATDRAQAVLIANARGWIPSRDSV